MADGTRPSFGGLAETKAARIRDAILVEAARLADQWGKRLNALAALLLSCTRYIRYSDSRELHKNLLDLTRQRGRLVRDYLEQSAKGALDWLELLKSNDAFEEERKRLNEIYVRSNIASVKAAAGTDLTDEQATAIATDEDATLVLAGAGTGKTKVIVGKVAHLVRNQGVNPSEILVLAFNVKAAEEIRERLPTDLSKTNVFNFHAFGNNIIGKSEGKKLPVSKLAEDDIKLSKAIDDILWQLIHDAHQSQVVINFILNHRNPLRSPFDFKEVSDYRRYINSIERRTLSGDLVRSHEELQIANYLTISGIRFTYEQPYAVDIATSQHGQYRPDFFLPDYYIYIEHFALDENECPPQNWTDADQCKYVQEVERKRTIHEENGTTLVETYSWQSRQGTLLGTLRTKLEEMGVDFNPIPIEELVERLREERISWLSKLLISFLSHVRGGNIKPAALRDSVGKLKGHDNRRDMAFLNVFEQVRIRYEELLENSNEIDFDDQINLAVNHIQQGSWESPFRYVLVDEFQDISRGRMRLLQSLMRQNGAYFLVGDDWQSIYRFNGSDLGIVRNVSAYLGCGYVQERTLSKTFRFGNRILGPSTTFIKRNPEQTQRALEPATSVEDGGMTVVACKLHEVSLQWALKDIESKSERIHPDPSILVLGRYNSSRPALSKARSNIEFSTVHRAKGREADYVIVVDLNDDRWGFPSKIEDDPIMDLVLPPASDDALPFAEERRLFYVAMTRARIGAYLIADSVRPSIFVEELQKYDDFPQVGVFAEKCPRCKVGVLVKREGPYSTFLGCTEYGAEPSCRYKRPIKVDPEDAIDEEFWRRFSVEDYSI